MDQRISNYLNVLTSLDEIPTDPITMIETAPPVGYLPPPQVSATLAALMHYRGRLMWAKKVRRKVLDPLIHRAFVANPGTDEYMENGYVPNMPDWEFYVEPSYTILTNRVTGEYIFRVEGVQDNVLSDFDIYQQFQNPESVTPSYQRVMELFPNFGGIEVAIEYLRERGVLSTRISDITLAPSVARYQDSFDRLASMLASPGNRLRVAVATGDWLAAHGAAEEIGDARLIGLTQSRALECRQQWLTYLQEKASTGLSCDLLCALADAGGLEPYLPTAFSNEATVGTAARLVQDDPRWCDRVYEVFQRLLKGRPDGCRIEECAGYLVRHGHRARNVLTQLSELSGCNCDAIELALHHVPRMVPALLRQGIRSDHQSDRLIAAAVLALIDSQWSRNELVAALHESNDVERTAECRIALRESIDPEIRDVPGRWEKAYCDNQPTEEATEHSMMQVMSRLFDAVNGVRQLLSPI